VPNLPHCRTLNNTHSNQIKSNQIYTLTISFIGRNAKWSKEIKLATYS